MSVGRICSRVVATTRPEETVQAAAKRMAEHGVGTLVVVRGDGDSRPIGILTDRDIAVRCVAERLDCSKTPVEQVMTHPVRSVHEDMPIEHGILRMSEASARRLVVTGDKDELVGLLSLDDVLDLLIGEVKPLSALLERQQPHIPA